MQQQSDLDNTIQSVITDLRSKFSDVFSDQISEKLKLNCTKSAEAIIHKLNNDSPYRNNRERLVAAERDFRHFGSSEERIIDDLKGFKLLNNSVDGSFWIEKRKELISKKKGGSVEKADISVRRNIQESWRKDYELKELDWQLAEIEKYRISIYSELSKWLEQIREISRKLKSLGLESGVLWDLSEGLLTKHSIEQLLKWAEYLNGNEDLKRLSDLLGRVYEEARSHEIVVTRETRQIHVRTPDIDSKEEISGICLGNDLENVIPQELSLLTDLESSILFDLKYVERRLMCFEKHGFSNKETTENIDIETTVQQIENKGPVIICVDTSGSMQGAPEAVAKALTMLIASKASKQSRPCYIINFSTQVSVMDLRPPKGIQDLIDFLQLSFCGGTDVSPALHEGIRMMDQEGYKKSDLLVISDFVLSINDKTLHDAISKQRVEGNKFYALSIGQFRIDSVDALFDAQWIYNSRNGSISQLDHIIETLSKS